MTDPGGLINRYQLYLNTLTNDHKTNPFINNFYNKAFINRYNNQHLSEESIEDLELLIKLGQAALIVFIILAFVIIVSLLIYLIIKCCQRPNNKGQGQREVKSHHEENLGSSPQLSSTRTSSPAYYEMPAQPKAYTTRKAQVFQNH